MAEAGREAGRDPDDEPGAVLMESLRTWTGVFGEFSRRFGAGAGMHVTDSDALIHVINAEDKGRPLTQSELSRRIGLSTGATSSLLNRLEDAGHIERRRDRADRRVVTLRSTPAVHDRVETFFADVGKDLADVIAAYPRETVAQFGEAIRAMTDVMEAHLAEDGRR